MLQVCSNTEDSFFRFVVTLREASPATRRRRKPRSRKTIFLLLFEAFYISTLQEEACGAEYKFSQHLEPTNNQNIVDTFQHFRKFSQYLEPKK